MSASKRWQEIQAVIGTQIDGFPGPHDDAALAQLRREATEEHTGDDVWHEGIASCFATVKDVAAFKRCKAGGGSDNECFAIGDNGIGCWTDDTTASRPMCALPPEKWKPFGKAARGKLVRVRINGREFTCELRDTMPAENHITNHATIDLNPAAVEAAGLFGEIMAAASWKWA